MHGVRPFSWMFKAHLSDDSPPHSIFRLGLSRTYPDIVRIESELEDVRAQMSGYLKELGINV